MITKCPHCGGILREKHYESIVERGEKMKEVHLRCTGCGKWVQHKVSDV